MMFLRTASAVPWYQSRLFSVCSAERTLQPASEGVELVRALDMAMERRRVELRQEEYPVDFRVDAVADRDVHEPVFPGEGYRGLATLVCQGREPRPAASAIMTASTRFWVVMAIAFSIVIVHFASQNRRGHQILTNPIHVRHSRLRRNSQGDGHHP